MGSLKTIKSESMFLPAGLSGIMDYTKVAEVKEYPIKLKPEAVVEGKFCKVVVEKVDKTGISFHILTNILNVVTNEMSLIRAIQLLQYAEVFGSTKLIYHK